MSKKIWVTLYLPMTMYGPSIPWLCLFFSATPKKIDTLNPTNTVYIIIDFGLPIPSPVHIKHPLNETMFFCWEFSHHWDHYGVFDIRVMGL